MNTRQNVKKIGRLFNFLLRVLRGFKRNQGLLLSGAGYAATLTEQVRVFLEHRKVIGIIGFVVMLFFSSIAVLEKYNIHSRE